MIMEAPVPITPPVPQFPSYQIQFAPVPNDPPLTFRVMLLPRQTWLELLLAPEGAEELVLIVTLNEQLDVPHTLDAVHVTVVVPVTKVEPDAGTQTTVADGLPPEVGLIQVAT
jgi:hypothetical protein